jgi:hypothetical protein
MKTTYLVIGWGIIALGALHISATPVYFHSLTPSALWFGSGGLALVLTGTLNLLNRTYGQEARGLRRVCVAANLVMAGFSLVSGLVGHASAAQLVVVVGLMSGAAALSLTRAATAARSTSHAA